MSLQQPAPGRSLYIRTYARARTHNLIDDVEDVEIDKLLVIITMPHYTV